jgi:biotin transport system substrate-specific component
MAKIALCVSLLSVVSWFVLPLPMSPAVLSFQTVAVGLTALILSPGQCAWAMVLYISMGAIGLPVFSGGTAGVGKLFGVTGGYYFGFLISAVLVSLLKGKEIDFKRYTTVTVGVAIPVQHICAVAMMCLHNGGDVAAAFTSISLPFIVGDIIKGVATALLGVAVNKALRKNKM